MSISRREFLVHASTTASLAMAAGAARAQQATPPAAAPVAIASGNGLRTVDAAYKRMMAGEDPLDAAIAGVNIIEDDPEDTSVGYGGLPNEEGVVELDASVMHGPTHSAGAVAAIRNIKNPSRVAKLVMERTNHVLLVGEGALRFAKAMGFAEENLLTEKARKRWLYWKATLSATDNWNPDPRAAIDPDLKDMVQSHGTVHCSARSVAGDLGGVTSTSGLPWKLPGRVGDSPIIGAGLFTDNDVGSAGGTGRGESVIVAGGSRMVVEALRTGKSPTDACLAVLDRIAYYAKKAHLVRADGRPSFDVKLYALAKDGRFGSAGLFAGGKFAVADQNGARLEDCAFLFDK
ncbi:MAG: N(4)-(beta-N-acetylglucosaminyl)-L-asparaginase [Planctomycetota bacterium]